jgi:hypothetical protein
MINVKDLSKYKYVRRSMGVRLWEKNQTLIITSLQNTKTLIVKLSLMRPGVKLSLRV